MKKNTRKTWERFGKNEGEWTRQVEISSRKNPLVVGKAYIIFKYILKNVLKRSQEKGPLAEKDIFFSFSCVFLHRITRNVSQGFSGIISFYCIMHKIECPLSNIIMTTMN